MTQERNGVILTSAFIGALGLIGAAWVLGVQFKYFHKTGEITVKGVAQKAVKADLANWRVGVELHADDYSDAVTQLRQDLPKVKDFLLKQGFEILNINLEAPKIQTHFEEKETEHGYTREANGYDAEQYFIVTTTKLENIKSASTSVLDFRSQNSFVRFEPPQYLISNLANIKQNLISLATADAYSRAEKFATTGHTRVTQMHSASQGSFNIYPAILDDSNKDESYGGTYDTSTIDKHVRLVVTIKYGIE